MSTTLVARPRFVHPDVQWQSGVVGAVNRRQRGTPVDRGQPARVAMGEHLQRAPALFPVQVLEQAQAVVSDGPVDVYVLVANLGGEFVGCRLPFASFERTQCLVPALQRADQGRTADLHAFNGQGGVFQGLEAAQYEFMRQPRLVDDIDLSAVFVQPDGTVWGAVYIHGRQRYHRPGPGARADACPEGGHAG